LRESLRQRFDSVPAKDIAVIVSPMIRTMQTASLALDWLSSKGVVFEANADWQGE
jgi:broad specificity phosphatase PhoE